MENMKKVEEMNYFELLAWLGFGSAHPGGFLTTEQTISTINLSTGDKVLEAGCGSGLTACYLAKKTGAKIIGVDINPVMIEKARKRAEQEGVSQLVEFMVADVYHLPFHDSSFDWVIAESVTVFLNKQSVFGEFYRVLRPHGQIADLELALLREIPWSVKKQMQECFGIGTDPLSFNNWCKVLSEVGFEHVAVKNPQEVKAINFRLDQAKQEGLLHKELQAKIMKQPGLLPRLLKNADFISKYQSYFGFGLLYGQKSGSTSKKISLTKLIRRMIIKSDRNYSF